MAPGVFHYHSAQKEDSFKFYKPHTRGNAARITDEQWEPHFPLIQSLHNARKTRAHILGVLRQHGLEPSVAQLYSRMSKWGLKGYGAGSQVGEQCQEDSGSEPGCGPSGVSSNASEPPADSSEESVVSSEDSQLSAEPSDCFSTNDVDTSDTMYETDEKPSLVECRSPKPSASHSEDLDASADLGECLDGVIDLDAMSISVNNDSSSQLNLVMPRLPTDLMQFVYSSADMSESDRCDILNEVSCFLCITNSFSDAFVLFDATYSHLKNNQSGPLALVFATINCLRSATFKEQCQYAGSLMGEALAALRIISYSDPYAEAAFSCLEHIGRELCFTSELENLNILYSQMQSNLPLASNSPSDMEVTACLLHCSDPFLVAGERSQFLSHSIEVNNIALGRIIGKLSGWCVDNLADFNPVNLLPSAGFNPLDPVSVSRFATALSCHFIRKWSFLSLSEVLGHCNELLPPNRKDAGTRLCKLAVRVLSTLAAYTIYQATGVMKSVSEDHTLLLENLPQYTSPLASHLDTLSRLKNSERVSVFAKVNKTLYNRTLKYRQDMDEHCLMAHVRETGFLLAASLIRLKRELSQEVPRPASIVNYFSTSPAQSTVPSRRGSDASSSMHNLARRNLLVPGIMSKNGSHKRKSWVRRLSTDSNESWNFTKVTGLPAGPSPPASIRSEIRYRGNDGDDDGMIVDLEFF